MDIIKIEQLVAENMKSVFGFALTRLGNVIEAEDLASDILYEIIRSVQNLKSEESFYGFMWRIAENTYADYLRKKSKKANYISQLNEEIADESESALDEMIRNDEINVLRRELSLLSKQYREITVLYYIGDLSCSEIANRLKISTEMVKYYLFRARKIIREGINMERLYGEKSYHPNYVKIDFWGSKGGEDREYREFQNRKIKGNILISAYYSPVTIQEISIELGVSLPYLEDEIKLLCDRQYLVYKNGKYLTNIPLFTIECSKTIDEKMEAVTKETAERFVVVADEFNKRFGNRFANENLRRWQKILLCLNFALNITGDYIEEKYGELPKDGPYSLVNGGGGQGLVWAYEDITSDYKRKGGIRGIYTADPLKGDAGFIAMNFEQTLNAQMVTNWACPLSEVADGCFDCLPDNMKKNLIDLGYVKDGKANFAVWTKDEYVELQKILSECTEAVISLNRKTIENAAYIAADMAPTHIRSNAEYVGAIAYRFRFIEDFVDTLFDMGWLKPVDDKDKPAICIVKD